MRLESQYEKMASYLKNLPEDKQINLDDISEIYTMKLNVPRNNAIWYNWDYKGNLILNNGPLAVVSEMLVTLDEFNDELCLYKGIPLTAMKLRRMCCMPLQAEPVSLDNVLPDLEHNVVII